MIRILPPEEAKKIAAGEVIDRPAALVREFLDNAIDSGASSIEVSIEGGGSRKVEVADNGQGMGREDLELCIKPHATSKIQSLDDLAHSRTLGFRGEALAAAAAVARLEILSSSGKEAWLLENVPSVDSTAGLQISAARRTRGTSVRALGLFDAIPARKRFLKRDSSEAQLCRQIFLEKALAFPGIGFRFIQDGEIKLNLLPQNEPGAPAAYRARFGELVSNGTNFLHTVETAGRGFQALAVFAGPELYRQDRRNQYIYVNKRRVQDYGLMQALEYGLEGFFPNGVHPVGAVFVDVDPALADFNIHPAKREVRFADPGAIHHGVSSILREYTRGAGFAKETASTANAAPANSPAFDFGQRGNGFPHASGNTAGARLAMEALLENRSGFGPLPGRHAPSSMAHNEETAAEEEPAYAPLRIAGRIFDLFIIAEREDRIYLIDQHAAHERLLYDQFLSKPVSVQELLVPIPFTTESAGDDTFLEERKDELARLGIILANEGEGNWRIDALPSLWKAGDGETVEEILSLKSTGAGLARRWAAALACKAAIKDGGFLDEEASLALAKAALALEGSGVLPRCPHGRPLWTEMSREDLYRAVRRIE